MQNSGKWLDFSIKNNKKTSAFASDGTRSLVSDHYEENMRTYRVQTIKIKRLFSTRGFPTFLYESTMVEIFIILIIFFIADQWFASFSKNHLFGKIILN